MEQQEAIALNGNSLFGQVMQLSDHTMIMDESCLLHQAVTLLADKWTLLVLLSLFQGSKRTSELLRQISGISPKMLTQTLRKLEDNQLVARTVFPVVPPKVEYSLTPAGRELESVLSALYDWRVKHSLA